MIEVVPPLLRELRLPAIGTYADKNARGRVLIVGGSRETPGGVLLAGTAALRVGAGRLQIATVESAATALAVTAPEARVIGLAETPSGSICASAAASLASEMQRDGALLVGTSTIDPDESG